MLLGSHLSTAGGLEHALQAARGYGLECVAMFVRSHLQWSPRPLDDESARRFRLVRRQTHVGPVVAHGSYLVNLAAEGQLRKKSIDAVCDEMSRCGRLGIEYLVYHPGSAGDGQAGLARVAEAIDAALDRCSARRPMLLLETTAGQGNSLGCSFEQLAGIRAQVRRRRRVGVCFDTCHAFAAGYPIHTPAGYRDTFRQFDETIGLEWLRAIHLNDSKRPFDSHVDRHERIGGGCIPLAAFRRLVNDPRLASVPMILETPKGKGSDGTDLDEINIKAVRGLLRRR